MKRPAPRLMFAAAAVLLLAAYTALIAGGLLSFADSALQDRFYQQEQASSGDVVLIGIDDRAIDELGPYSTWGRDVFAGLIRALNASEEVRPAAICLDILFTGVSNEEDDNALAEAAAEYGNVIVGSSVEFGTRLNADRTLDTQSIVTVSEPYEALAAAANVGNINAMLDSDGIARHHLLAVTMPDGSTRRSMALMAAEMLRAYRGEEPVELPRTRGLGFWYLPFTGTPGAFDEGISAADVLNGDIPAEYFSGRIVMIGPYSVGLGDNYPTSIDHGEYMYGLEIQANAVEALLYPDYKTEVPLLPQLIALWVLAAALPAAAARKRFRLTAAVWLAETAGWLALARILYSRGLLLTILWVPLGLTLLFGAAVVFRTWQYGAEKRAITGMFKHYVAPEIVNELIRQGPEALALGGRTADIAVLFVDVRGFTAMSENLPPEEVVAILNEYLTLVTDCVIGNRGTLDKFVGDAAMAVWGSPLKQEDYVMLAVRAAMDMVRNSRALSEKLTKKYGRTVSFGIGIHTGEAVVGNMGSAIHMDYTAIGDTVNTAARLEANAPGGHVYISRAVADALEGRISYTSLGGSIPLKGKKEGFEVLDLRIPEEQE